MPRESRTPSMDPEIVIEGIEIVIERDLEKHKSLLSRTEREHRSWRNARSHEVQKKRYYKTLIGGNKYNDEALRNSIKGINVNIRHLSDKVKLAEDKMDHHQMIIDTLTEKLKNVHRGLEVLKNHRRNNPNAFNN